jgi:hypothetical protein
VAKTLDATVQPGTAPAVSGGHVSRVVVLSDDAGRSNDHLRVDAMTHARVVGFGAVVDPGTHTPVAIVWPLAPPPVDAHPTEPPKTRQQQQEQQLTDHLKV